MAKGLVIPYFRTGLYTHRSQLFAPVRSVGINIVQMKDALIDGQDMEVTDLLEVQRRPGFSRFCSIQLNAGEIVNQFYSFRSSAGTVFPLFDSNQRFCSFASGAITTLWTKPSSDQAFPVMVGTQLYIFDGTTNGQKRYDTGTAALHSAGILGPVAMPTVAPPTIAGTTFWQPNIVYAANAVILDPNGNVQLTNSGVTSGAQPPIWSTIYGAVTLETVSGWQNIGPYGNTWSAGFVYRLDQPPAVIIDSNGNLQHLVTAGTSGATAPAWSSAVGVNTTDNTAVWKCLGKGVPSVFSGYIYAYTYSTQAPTVTTGYYHCSTASPQTYITGTVFGTYNYVVSGAFSTNADVTSVDLYRILDGGSVLDYAGSIVNNTAGGTWNFSDNLLDSTLNTAINVPLQGFRRNDVPPGQTGSLAPSTDKAGHISYWQGRFWAVGGSKVYFDAGADCQNGDPHASWPPANVFAYPGDVICTTPTSAGLLVWLSDSVKIIAGGPQTLSFFTVDLLANFGISSPNCVDKDGDTIRVITTQGQEFSLTVSDKTEDGNFVADLIQTDFAPAGSYITTHRNGLDSGVFIGNGTDTILRYGLNIGAWSTIYKPVGGIRALKSIETSVGKYTLCAGRATTAGFILGRDLTTNQDDSQNYSNCFATVGNIVLSAPLQELASVGWIGLYLAAVGSIPTVSILPNEISGTSGVGFIPIPNPVDELGMTPSTTLLSKLWSLSNQQTLKTSLLFHHMQVRIAFPAENFPNTIKVLSLIDKLDKD